MSWLFVVNTLVEGATGLVMIGSPATIFAAGDALTFSVARSLGVAACALAVLSAAMIRITRPSPALMPGLLTLAVFHTGAAAALVPAVSAGFTPLPVLVTHTLLAVAFIAAVIAATRGRGSAV